jgi:hypothetical protein
LDKPTSHNISAALNGRRRNRGLSY